jgi:hypothetical protein
MAHNSIGENASALKPSSQQPVNLDNLQKFRDKLIFDIEQADALAAIADKFNFMDLPPKTGFHFVNLLGENIRRIKIKYGYIEQSLDQLAAFYQKQQTAQG